MQQVSTTDWLLQLLDHRHFLPAAGMLLGAIAIVTIATVIITVVKLSLAHRQRMAMIARGMHPDDVLAEGPEQAPPQLPPHA